MSEDRSLSTLAGSAAVVFIATVAGQAVALLSELLIIRSLEPTIFGRLALAYSIIFSVGNLLLLGVHEGVTRQFSAVDSAQGRSSVVFAGYAIAAVSGMTGVIIILSIQNTVESFMTTEDLGYYLVLLSPFLLVHPLSRISHAALRAKKQTLEAVGSQEFAARASAFCLLLLFLYIGQNVTGAIVYWVTFPVVTLLFTTYFLRKNLDRLGSKSVIPDRGTVARLWAFSWPLAVGSGIFLLLGNIDLMMIGYFLTSQDVGFYRTIQPLKKASTLALGAFTFLFLPIATEQYNNGHTEQLNRLFKVSTKWILAATLPPVLLFAFYSEAVIQVLYGSKYLPAAPALSILLGGLLFRAMSGLDGDVVKAINRPRIELYSGTVGLVTNIALNLLLIPAFGIVGAATATVMGYVVYNGVELVWIKKLTGVTPFSVDIIKFVSAMVALAATTSMVVPHVGVLGLVVLGISFVLIQPVVLIITGSVDEADIELIDRLETRTGVDLQIVKGIIGAGL